jgi:hypothetical protein
MGMPAGFVTETMKVFEELDDVAETIAVMEEHGWVVRDSSAPAHACISSAELHLTYKQFILEHGSSEQKRNMLGIKQFSQRLTALGWQRVRSGGTRWVGWRLPSSTADQL